MAARLPNTLVPALLSAVALLTAGPDALAESAHAAPSAQVSVVGGSPAAGAQQTGVAAILTHQRRGGTDASRQFCGGSLISSRVVLTAAHCLQGRTATDLQVVLGRPDLLQGGGESIDVTAAVSHPVFNPRSYRNDVALLQLASPSAQPPLSMLGPAERGLVSPWQTGVVLGWGATSEAGPASAILRSVEIPTLPDRSCSRGSAYGANYIPAAMLCAGDPSGGGGSCSGDSGGPLVVGGRVTGVVSWALGCSRPGFPTVFSRLANPSINRWARSAANALEAGVTAEAPPRTVVRHLAGRKRATRNRVRILAPGEPWAAFQCSSRGRRYRICPQPAHLRPPARGSLRVRAIDVFGASDPSPVLVRPVRRK